MTDDYGNTRATADVLSAGVSASGVVETTGDIDAFAVTLTAGTTYSFRVEESGSLGGANLSFFDDVSGLSLGTSSSFGTPILFTARATGTYYLFASASSGTGPYTVN